MGFEASNAVFKHSKSKMAERLVMLSLADRADEDRQCYPSIADTARRANLNETVTARVLERLVQSGELLRLYSTGKRSSYIITCGLTEGELRQKVKNAWNKTLEQVTAINQMAEDKMSKSDGNVGTLKPNTKKDTLLAGVERSDPSSGSTETLLAGVQDPSSAARTEPSYNHQKNQQYRSGRVSPKPKGGERSANASLVKQVSDAEHEYRSTIYLTFGDSGVKIWDAVIRKDLLVGKLTSTTESTQALIYATAYALHKLEEEQESLGKASAIMFNKVKAFDGSILPPFNKHPAEGEIQPEFLKYIW